MAAKFKGRAKKRLHEFIAKVLLIYLTFDLFKEMRLKQTLVSKRQAQIDYLVVIKKTKFRRPGKVIRQG